MPETVILYTTWPDAEKAEAVGAEAVAERLAACANIFAPIISIYRWEGAIEEGRESIIIAKTRHELFNELSERVKAIHSYSVPCIVEIPLGRIDGGYLDWLTAETGRT